MSAKTIIPFLSVILALAFSSTAFGQATDVQCNKCVDVTDLNTNSVGTARIIDQAVTTAKIKNEAISTQKIKGGAITSGKIKDGTVRSQDVDASQVQLRVSGSCAVGDSIRSINENGTIVCAPSTFRAVALVDRLPLGLDQNYTRGFTSVTRNNTGEYCLTADNQLGLDPDTDISVITVEFGGSTGTRLQAYSANFRCPQGQFGVETRIFDQNGSTASNNVEFFIGVP